MILSVTSRDESVSYGLARLKDDYSLRSGEVTVSRTNSATVTEVYPNGFANCAMTITINRGPRWCDVYEVCLHDPIRTREGDMTMPLIRRRIRIHRHRRGFTLAEVVVAMTLLSVVSSVDGAHVDDHLEARPGKTPSPPSGPSS